MNNGRDSTHATQAELDFLDKIGSYSPIKINTVSGIRKLLTGYLIGAEKRTKWDNLDKLMIVAHAKMVITRGEAV